MCGIAGHFGPSPLEESRIRKALDRMKRRGPDHAAAAHWVNRSGRHVDLLHSRLKIIDLDDRANQPFRVGHKILVFNGELYNYLELRASLERDGAVFRTSSDTEVFLQAIACRGWQVLDECEGMWAFAVYDEDDGSLTLGRDRFGEKPLYLARHASGLYFGSEVKLLSALLPDPLAVNPDQILRFLVNGYKSLYKTRETFFQGVEELPPATLLHLDASGRERSERYWSVAFDPNEAMTYEEAVAGTRERLIEAVKIRMRADVPLAFCMSGGVDSNSLISIASRILGREVHGFTVCDQDARYEENELVAHAVAELGVRHTSVPSSTVDFLDRLRGLVRYHDAPVYTITYYTHWLLMREVAEKGYRISVSGSGADELFSGYYDHHLAYLYELRSRPEEQERSRANWERVVLPYVRNPHLRRSDLFLENPSFRDHIFMDATRFRSYLLRDWQEPFSETAYTEDLLRNRMLNELCHEGVPVILHEDDLNAMHHSVENRSPFLDRRLFEHCSRIPTRYLIRDGLAKAVLRDAVAGIVPDRIRLNPRKVGFNAAIFSYLEHKNPAVRSAVLDRSPIYEWVRRDEIERLLDAAQLSNSESKFLFSFLGAKMFLEEWAG